jgi:DNA-binding transcriptional LysR family regulator
VFVHDSCQYGYMLDVRRLRVLRELDHRGTVTAAAQALHLTPSAVSQHLAALTRETGAQLVEPHGRTVRLTPEGQLLLEHAHRIFAELERAEADLAAHTAGRRATLRIGGFPTALSAVVAPAAARLLEELPGLAVQLNEIEERRAAELLADGSLDIAVTVEQSGVPQHDDPRFLRLPLLSDRLDAALAAGHPLAAHRTLRLEQLADQPWVLGSEGTSCHEIALVACASAGFTPQARHRTSDWGSVGAIVGAGLAVALMPRLASHLAPPEVTLVPLAPRAPARHVLALVRRGSEAAETIARALGHLQQAADGSRAVRPPAA